jgi:hypothetical protein
MQIRYKTVRATIKNMSLVVGENPVALHFSGHGVENNKDNFGFDFRKFKNEGNFLVLEDDSGCTDLVSAKMLTRFVKDAGAKIELVFVASCYSQFAGEIFRDAGVDHVVCVRKG